MKVGGGEKIRCWKVVWDWWVRSRSIYDYAVAIVLRIYVCILKKKKKKKRKKMVERVDWNFEETKGINLNRWGEEVIHIYEFVRDNLSFFFFFFFLFVFFLFPPRGLTRSFFGGVQEFIHIYIYKYIYIYTYTYMYTRMIRHIYVLL